MNFKKLLKKYCKQFEQKRRKFRLLKRLSNNVPEVPSKPVTCLNCGLTYQGNFCPKCGQKATIQKNTIHSFAVEFSREWSYWDKTVLTTLQQLFWRPGYLIRGYLQGKRATHFPPFKLLVVLSLIFGLILWFLPLHIKGEAIKIDWQKFLSEPQTLNSIMDMLNPVIDEYHQITLLIVHLLYIPFTKLFFKKAPAYPHASLFDNLIIQMYICCQLLAATIVYTLLSWQHIIGALYDLPTWIIFLIFWMDYKQIFGYGWWSTFWRTCCSLLLSILLLFILLILAVSIFYALQHQELWMK